MTIEELKQHCVRQITEFERIKEIMPVTPNDYKHYEEHKIVLQLIEAFEQEPCEDCISRQAVDELSKELVHTTRDKADFLCNFWEGLQKLPSVTPKEKTGHWIKTPKAVMGEGYMWYCDKCQYEVYQDTSKNYPSERYCPNCGAKMVEPQESENKEEK